MYSSLTTPRSIYDIDMSSGEKKLMKRDEVGGVRPGELSHRARVGAFAGRQEDPRLDPLPQGLHEGLGSSLLQYGYGSYGLSTDPSFNGNVLSLVDRGFVYAVANIRGGQELGRAWYEDGKLLNKKNTFNDFVDVTRFLVQQGYGALRQDLRLRRLGRQAAHGRDRQPVPRVLSGVIAAVPFVDVVTTMLDEIDSADVQRIRRVGKPEGEEVLRLHAVVLALRQRGEEGLSRDARDDRTVGQPSAVLRARQVGREASRHEDRLTHAPPAASTWRRDTAGTPVASGDSRSGAPVRLHRSISSRRTRGRGRATEQGRIFDANEATPRRRRPTPEFVQESRRVRRGRARSEEAGRRRPGFRSRTAQPIEISASKRWKSMSPFSASRRQPKSWSASASPWISPRSRCAQFQGHQPSASPTWNVEGSFRYRSSRPRSSAPRTPDPRSSRAPRGRPGAREC